MLIGHSQTMLVLDIDFTSHCASIFANPVASGRTEAQVILVVTEGHVTSHTPAEFSSHNNSCVILWGHACNKVNPNSVWEQVILWDWRGSVVSKSVSATSSSDNEKKSASPLLNSLVVSSASNKITDRVFDFVRSLEKSLYTIESIDTKHQPPLDGGNNAIEGIFASLYDSCSLVENVRSVWEIFWPLSRSSNVDITRRRVFVDSKGYWFTTISFDTTSQYIRIIDLTNTKRSAFCAFVWLI